MEMYLIKSLETGTALIVYPVDFAEMVGRFNKRKNLIPE